MTFDRKRFFQFYRVGFGPLNQHQVDALNILLPFFENDRAMTDIRWIAYCLATTLHETAGTYRPIEEYGQGGGRAYGRAIAVTTPTGKTWRRYYGRGYVQLTWQKNYITMSNRLGMGRTLEFSPERVMEPAIAYEIMSVGMREGLFTGVGLGKYISGAKCDYKNARRVINGTDKATLIAGYAEKIQTVLEMSLLP
jgi:putative chitinase